MLLKFDINAHTFLCTCNEPQLNKLKQTKIQIPAYTINIYYVLYCGNMFQPNSVISGRMWNSQKLLYTIVLEGINNKDLSFTIEPIHAAMSHFVL